MLSVLISDSDDNSQAGLFSAALTPFVVDSKQSLQVNPADQMVYYLQQHSTILSQISQQIASIAPEVSIPSTPPPPFPPFNQSASDIRINAFWFMALAFSLSAALLAILIQQWVRNYMHVFQRYSDLQKSARMRQYLYEGSEGWYMPIAAEAVPGLLHVSLFLFFAGLADSTLDINTTIGLSTTIPIGICCLLYIFTTLAPVIYPQSPYQTSFSGVIWYVIQKFRDRRFKDRDGESKSISTNMSQGQMQLSMEKTKERNGRDKRAILWLLDNLTEDAEIESFVMTAPRSLEVWTELSKEDVVPVITEPSLRLRMIPNVLNWIPRRLRTFTARRSSANALLNQQAFHSVGTQNPIVITSIHERVAIREFCWRISHFFDTCKNRAAFASDERWRMRARACVEVMASLVFKADAELGWFGDTLQVLGDIGSVEGVHNLSLVGKDQSFVVYWTCLSIMNFRPTLNRPKHFYFITTEYDQQDKKAQEADETLEHQWETERETSLSSKISFAAGIIQEVEDDTQRIIQRIIRRRFVDNEAIYNIGQRIVHQLPGVNFDLPGSEPFLRQSLDLFHDPAKLRFISCRQPLSEFLNYLKRIDDYRDNPPNSEQVIEKLEKVTWPKHLLQRRLWSLDDLSENGLGFAVELFLISLKQLLSTYPSHESYSAIYIGTFRAITSDRRRYGSNYLIATQNILLDAVVSEQGFLRTFSYPDYITDEVWELLGDMLEGRTGPHIDSAVRQLTDLHREVGGRYGAKAKAVISQISPSHSQVQSASAPTDSV